MAQEMNISPIKIKDLSKEIIDNIRGSGSKPGYLLSWPSFSDSHRGLLW